MWKELRTPSCKWLIIVLLLSYATLNALSPQIAFTESGTASISAPKKWDFDRINEWRDIAHVDEDSAELVIGLTELFQDNDKLLDLTAEKGGKIVNTIRMENRTNAVVVDVPLEFVSSFVSETYSMEFVSYVEPNLKFRLTFVPNDTYWDLQWGPRKIQADWAWNTTTGDPSILVAVVDTGIDYNHEDLADNYVPLGYDWVNDDPDPMDDNGHGTHSAGIVAAALNNKKGIAGLAQVRLMAEKCLNSTGWGKSDDGANAIIDAADKGAKILSLSWGSYEDSSLIRSAVRYAYNKGALLVAAAGNDGTNEKMYPAAYEEVIAVTATDQNDNSASFTNFGSWIELSAPGVEIFSTVLDNGYAYKSGTSMACPHVVGVASLVWSHFPNMTRDNVRLQLRETADDFGDPGFDVFYGYGRINAWKALEKLSHELIVSLDAPKSLTLNKTTILNATVFNLGKNDETNVEIQILINGTVASSQIIPELASGDYYKLNYTWFPGKGVYNVTAYVLPVPDEKIVENNVDSKQVIVQLPLIYPKPKEYAHYKIEMRKDGDMQTGLYNFSYVEYATEYLVKIRVDSAFFNSDMALIENDTCWIKVDTITRLVESGPACWLNTYYLGLIETDVAFEYTIDLFRGKGVVIGERNLSIGGRLYSTWLVSFSGETLPFNNYTSHHFYFDKATGLLIRWVSNNGTISSSSLQSIFPFTMTLLDTNIDRTPPFIAITNPAPNSIFANTTVTVEWTALDNETGIDHYSIYLNQVFLANSTQRLFLLSNLVEGSNTINVTAFDIAGNYASDAVTVRVDLTPPSIVILSPQDGFVTRETRVEVTWIGYDDETGIAYYTIYFNDYEVAKTNSTSYVLTDLEEGEGRIVVRGYDLAGNSENATLTIIVDTTTSEEIFFSDLIVGAVLGALIAASITFVVSKRFYSRKPPEEAAAHASNF